MLKKMVNGQEVLLSEQEEKQTLLYWEMNQRNPEYTDACIYDGKNDPFYDIETLKKIKLDRIEHQRKEMLAILTREIEVLEDDGKDASKFRLQRKLVRDYRPDLSGIRCLQDAQKIPEVGCE